MFDWQPVRPDPQRVARYEAAGWWTDDSLGDLLAAGFADAPDALFTVRSQTRPYRGTFADVDAMARRVASGLLAHGIGPGDVVAFQLPNWIEAAVTFYAVAYVGAVVVPIVHFYGTKEVGYILRRTRVRALVTTARFGAQDFAANLEVMQADGLPDLEWVCFVGDDCPSDAVPFTELLHHEPLANPCRVDASSPALVAYTSGTTSDPKGVVHVHRTINAEIVQLGTIQASAAPPSITGAPVGHGIGMLAALLLPVWRRNDVHLIDVWDPGTVLASMAAERLNAGQGSTFFLLSLLDHPDFDPAVHAPLMSHVGLGGAAVPIAVCERARALGIETSRSFGCTEHPSITGSSWDRPWEQRCSTDGAPLPGVEVRIVDDEGRDQPIGTAGEILSRGPDCSWGYTDPALTAAAFSPDGWYATGDVGVLDANGCLSITDRKKDIIIRGGENVSAGEIEELLVRMVGVAEVAVVAAPDVRLGEHACAFIRMADPTAPIPTLEEVRGHLAAAGLAKQKWPEELRAITDFPRTPSGKVQKFQLRARLRAEATDAS